MSDRSYGIFLQFLNSLMRQLKGRSRIPQMRYSLVLLTLLMW
ncbi:MAG TPA: hypothetical protein V6D35_04765 [Candidatus Sericytochromatia bacterium]